MQNLTKREIVQEIYKAKEECRRGDILQNDVKDIVQRTLDILCASLVKGRNVELRNFGLKFKYASRALGAILQSPPTTSLSPRGLS